MDLESTLMNFHAVEYSFQAKAWQYQGKGAWYFISLPKDISKEIREHFKELEEGWGRLKAKASIGSTEWDTAIWYDSKQSCYLLPLKAEIRRKENIIEGRKVKAKIFI